MKFHHKLYYTNNFFKNMFNLSNELTRNKEYLVSTEVWTIGCILNNYQKAKRIKKCLPIINKEYGKYQYSLKVAILVSRHNIFGSKDYFCMRHSSNLKNVVKTAYRITKAES